MGCAVKELNPWAQQLGRDLDPLPIEPGNWQRIVACLNIWNDLRCLQANIDSWYPHVDHVIAVDGAYGGMGCATCASTDGTLEFLRTLAKVELIEAPADGSFWVDQVFKRSQYFTRSRPGDLLWRIDADESFTNAQAIRVAPALDVGWIRYAAPIYRRTQGIPAVFAYRPGLHYVDRHHWVYDGDGRLVSTQQQGGVGLMHRLLPIEMTNSRGARRSIERIHLAKAQRRDQARAEATASPLRTQGHEPLRIVQLAPIDPGITVARLHSAINTTTPHGSVMGIAAQEWTEAPHQFDIPRHAPQLLAAAKSADLLHLHVNYDGMRKLHIMKNDWRGRTIMHHHGTTFRRAVRAFERLDSEIAALRLVSNLELLSYAPGLQYLPNPVPVAQYRGLADGLRPAWQHGTLRIAHSPTKRENKATDAFLRAVDRCRAQGLQVEAVLIECLPWRDALRLKATCHVTFDSFWLGMQNSGLEAAAMGQPVIAGDADCRREYAARMGLVPYTFANDEAQLAEAIERLATDGDYFRDEAARVTTFTLVHHDYAAVTAQYLDLLDDVFGWRDRLTIGNQTARRVPA